MLLPDVSWREKYASAALNRKFYGIIPTGIYRGFDVTDSGNSTVTVITADSIAVVESNGFSLTVTGDGNEESVIVPEGQWILAVEANYVIGGVTTAGFALVETLADNQVSVASIKNVRGVLSIVKTPFTTVGSAGAGNGLDFGELSIDLGEADQNNGGEVLDLGAM